ncbi:MAG: hypothetical protein O8C55_06845 [Candidatus Methanoperedens sp.]|nr:hypothetical protein [Candidatus Methanoperedens sp.]
MGKNKNKGNIIAELEGELIEKIDHLVEGTGQLNHVTTSSSSHAMSSCCGVARQEICWDAYMSLLGLLR